MGRAIHAADMARVLALAAPLLHASAVDAQAPRSAFIFGAGTGSCAEWTSTTPDARLAGSQWLLGFFSGMNVVVSASEQMGREADVPGILEKVRTICQEQPSSLLARAAVRAVGRDRETKL